MMSTEISYREKQERYQSLVREAWEKYQSGNHSEMAILLLQSLDATPYLRAETISDWISKFNEYSLKNQEQFDADYLSDLIDWEKAVSNEINKSTVNLFISQETGKLTANTMWVTVPVQPEIKYTVSGKIAGKITGSKQALIQFQFLDNKLKIIPGPYNEIYDSDNFGPFRYLSVSSQELRDFEVDFTTAANTHFVKLGFRTWQNNAPVLMESKVAVYPRKNRQKNFHVDYLTVWRKMLSLGNDSLSGTSKVIGVLRPERAKVLPLDYPLGLVQPNSVRFAFEKEGPGLLFIESAITLVGSPWMGVGNVTDAERLSELLNLIDRAKRQQVTTIFYWNSSPVVSPFLYEVAERCDLIVKENQNTDEYLGEKADSQQTFPNFNFKELLFLENTKLFLNSNNEKLLQSLLESMTANKLDKSSLISTRFKLSPPHTAEIELNNNQNNFVSTKQQQNDKKSEINSAIKTSLHIALYGDVNLNIIDGSSVWLQSIVQVLAKHPNAKITLLLKAPVQKEILLGVLRQIENVTIIDPLNHPLGKKCFPDLNNNLSVNQAVKLMVQLDLQNSVDLVIVRGIAAVSKFVENGVFRGRLWPYLTDVPQSPSKLDEASKKTLLDIAEASQYVLCQTEEIRSFMEAWLPNFRGKSILCPPMIPAVKHQQGQNQIPTTRKLRLFYAGKFAPNWNAIEIASLPAAFEKAGEKIELHVVGDKIHNVNDPPNFQEQVKRLLTEGEGVKWYGAKSRDKTMAIATECDIGISWRKPVMDSSLELSTKVLEYGALGLPAIINRTLMHEELLGADYPFFVANEADVVNVVKTAKHQPSVYQLAQERCKQAATRFTFDAVYETLAPYFHRAFPTWPQGRRVTQPLKVVVASHDLKFFTRLQDYLQRLPKLELRVDKWKALREHDPKQSEELLNWADVIICEWCAQNAVWYSHRKKPHQRLYVRFHRFEINTPFPRQLNIDNIDRIICVSDYYRDLARATFGWSEQKVMTISNWVDTIQFNRPKIPGANFNIGMIGMVPSLKRLDLGIDILEKLLEYDERYKLFIKSKMPWEYGWIWNKQEEQKHYQSIFKRINQNPQLKNSVVFDSFGKDVGLWLRKIGFILSTSDHESFHLAAAEGMTSGAIPILINRPGVETIFPKRWINSSVQEMAERIHSINSNQQWLSFSSEVKEEVEEYSLAKICSEWSILLCQL